MSAVNRGITHSYRKKSREPGKNQPGSGSTKEGKRGQMSPMHLAARGIIKRVPEKLSEAHAVDLCKCDRLQLTDRYQRGQFF
jgi:hypothetical protein